MMNDDEKLLTNLEVRIKQLMYYCDSLKEENMRIKQEAEEQKDTIISLSEKIDQLKQNYNNLKFAKSFSSDSVDEKEQAKKRLSKLVRDVDKCISLLKS